MAKTKTILSETTGVWTILFNYADFPGVVIACQLAGLKEGDDYAVNVDLQYRTRDGLDSYVSLYKTVPSEAAWIPFFEKMFQET